MIKTVPTLPRLAVMTLFALVSFGTVLYLWLAFGGSAPLKPKGYRFHVQFQEATQLAQQADVRIAGVPVGKVVAVGPGTANRTDATIEMRARYAPVPKDTRAILRLKSLLGETYVELTPGHRSAGTVAENGRLPDSAVSPTVELDEIMSTFDPTTRRKFQDWMQSQAQAVQGRGESINALFGQLPGFVESFDRLFETLDGQRRATGELIRSTGQVFDAISAREGELRGLIGDSDRLFATTARRNRDLAAIFRALPRFERESTATLPVLTAFGRRADPVIRQLQPAASAMGPAFAALDRLSPEFDGFFGHLGQVVDASEKGLPAFDRILGRLPQLLDGFQPFLRNANPMVRYIGRNQRELTAFFANVTAASNGYDNADVLPRVKSLGRRTTVNYLRTAQTLSPQGLAFLKRPMGETRANAYLAPGALDQLAQGLPVLSAQPCGNADPDPPATAIPDTLAGLVKSYAFRTDTGAGVARPPCREQGAFPGFTTVFPQLRADP
jgi:phospholipid/cholesterol/gamma-HCH transport system substrate-binding protein